MKKKFSSRFGIKKSIIILVIFGLSLAVWGFLFEPGSLTQKNISLNTWSSAKLRIAFFSDLHAGAPHINRNYIENLVERINAMTPDLILLGGDLVINGVLGGNAMPIEELSSILKNLKGRLGVYAVLGNHDWWNGADRIIASLEQNGIQVLENNAKQIYIDNESSFWLVGVGDDFTNHARLSEALEKVSSSAPRILFMHDPGAILQSKEPFTFAFAGHLHGGQIFIPSYGAIVTPGRAPREWAKGWVNFPLGSLYVSKGIGTSMLPLRINALPEFVVLDLDGSKN